MHGWTTTINRMVCHHAWLDKDKLARCVIMHGWKKTISHQVCYHAWLDKDYESSGVLSGMITSTSFEA